MKLPSFVGLCLVLGTIQTPAARAGLAEATDHAGPWTAGSYSSYEPGSLELWVDQRALNLDGVDAASGRLAGIQAESSWMETTVTGPGTLYFSYKVEGFVSSYGGTFKLILAGTQQTLLQKVEGGGSETITTGWKEAAIPIGSGTVTARWQLDAFRGFMGGMAYVDQVWTSSDPRPRITSTSTTGTVGVPMNWVVPVQSATPATLQASDLPPGLTLSPGGTAVTGTPTQAGTFESTITAENAAGKHMARVTFTLLPGSTSIPEGLDMPQQTFTQGSATSWSGITGFGTIGNDSVRGLSRPLTGADIRTLGLSTIVEGPGKLSFWYYAEGESFSDYASIMYFEGVPTSATNPTAVFYERKKWTPASLDIPPGRQTITLVPYRGGIVPGQGGPGSLYAYIDGMSFESTAAEIAVAGGSPPADIPDGSVQSFGTVLLGSPTTLEFTIANPLPNTLTGLGTTLQGPDASSFEIVTAPTAPVIGPTGTTSLVVRFAPTGTGTKTATLRIESNDLDENPFDLTLVGQGSTIRSQPVSQVVGGGEGVTFSVESVAAGSSYQWRKDGRDIPGATGSSLVFPSAGPWHVGEYSVVVTSAAGSVLSAPASLRITGVPEGAWRGLVSYYPLDGHAADLLRPGLPMELVNGASLITDPERGPVASINGKGFAVPPFPSENPSTQGPGGYIRIPRPMEARGESFTVSLWVRERGYSSWHGEAFLALGEGASSPALVGRYSIGGLQGQSDVYAAFGGQILEAAPLSSAVVANDGTAMISKPSWKHWTITASGETVRFYSQGVYRGSIPYPSAVAGDLFIGRHWWMDGVLRYSTRFQGEVDDVRVYNRALSDQEVRQLHVESQPVLPPSPYDDWAVSHGLTGAAGALNDDTEGDGWTTIEEYLFGTHPAQPTADVARWIPTASAGTLEWFGRRDARYAPAMSNDLRLWQPLDRPIVPAPDQSGVPTGYERLQLELPERPATGARALQVVRIEALIEPFLADSGRLDLQPAGGEPVVGGQALLGPSSGLPWASYQWLKDGVPLPGATQATLVIPAVQSEHSGAYRLIVSNSLGTASSLESYLRVKAPTTPTVKTTTPSPAGPGQASTGGLVVEDGGRPVLERGIVHARTENPTLEGGVRVPSGNGLGFYETSLSGLAPGAPVHVRAYALTAVGVAYGENLTLTPPAGP